MVVTIVGLLAVFAGAAALVVGFGWLGRLRAQAPVADPIVMDWLAGNQAISRIGAVLLGLLLLALGLGFVIRSLRPEEHPDIELDHTTAKSLRVTASAIAHAVQADVEQLDGVSRARARIVGDRRRPALRLNLWLREDSDVKTVWRELDSVLGRTKDCLGVSALPTAVRIELAAAQRQRVR
ncbi:alkaline shock response membrane anchor protein AmaP [Saccharothrix deserti]|uniref:alkaline shock response membrane anchor protein AmaP n=1 Tax=Saccharothrix deserti TaxID=2593674 RepID=UPI003B75C16A